MRGKFEKVGAERMVTIEEVNRLLEVGKLLRSVLTDQEMQELAALFNSEEAVSSLNSLLIPQ